MLEKYLIGQNFYW